MTMLGDLEYFPWSVVDSLNRVSPHVLQKVKIALQLLVETYPASGVGYSLSTREYEGYFRQVRSALPELGKKVIMSIAVRHSSRLFADLTYMPMIDSLIAG